MLRPFDPGIINKREREKNMDLTQLRKDIDEIDRQLVELYEQRMDICKRVAEYKIENHKSVFDKLRETEKLQKVCGLARKEENRKGVEELFTQLMSLSRKLQYGILLEHEKNDMFSFTICKELVDEHTKVIFQGAEGAYSQLAMEQFFGREIDCDHVDTFREAMEYVADGKADFAVLPIENSTVGIVSEIYDLLVEFENVIVGEQIIPINHCLLGVPGAALSDIRKVYSHPQSLMQTEQFLSTHPDWEQIKMQNNAFAARKVSEDNDKTQAAIASEYAAQRYGLTILQRGIHQCSDNATRFIVISGKKIFLEKAQRISVCFELPHESGALYHILSNFIYNNLNMSRIESRPVKDKGFEYRFFIDCNGNLKDAAVQNALRGLKEEALNFRILGNY